MQVITSTTVLHNDMGNTSCVIASRLLFATRFRKTIITANQNRIYRNLKRPKRMALWEWMRTLIREEAASVGGMTSPEIHG